MSAPLPNRFYNPVKELCKKVNLDYETVLGTGIQNKVIRDAFLNAEIPKQATEFNSEDRKLVKHKKDFFEKKYGDARNNSAGSSAEGTPNDTGVSRYIAGASVEYVLPDPSTSVSSEAVSDGVGASEFGLERAKHRPTEKWIPGKGVK
jgi:hypothetical protein